MSRSAFARARFRLRRSSQNFSAGAAARRRLRRATAAALARAKRVAKTVKSCASKAERTRSPLTPSEIAGWRAGLSVARAFAGDPDDSVVLAYLENAACAVVETAAARRQRAAAKRRSRRIPARPRLSLAGSVRRGRRRRASRVRRQALSSERIELERSRGGCGGFRSFHARAAARRPRARAAACDALGVAVAAAEASAELEKNSLDRVLYG